MMKGKGFYNIVVEQTYHDGEIIFEEGKSGDWVCVVISGSVEVSKIINGRKFIFGILKSREIFGELALIGAVKRTATVRAIGETTIGIIDRAFLDYELNKMSSDFRAILLSVVHRYIHMMDRIKDFSSRKHDRVMKRLTVKYKDHQTLVAAVTSNLSAGGVFIRTENPLSVGERFLIALDLEDLGETLEIPCQVKWTREKASDITNEPPGMGVEFSELSQKNAQLLKRYLKPRMK
jgi:type IV pilus assembly protein PilZ